MTSPAPEPVAVEQASTAAASASIDAPLEVKAASFAPTLGSPVLGPGEAETAAAAPVGPRTAVRGQHNWVSIGPRNVGGRVRAIAVEPGDPRIMYAAPASGGVFKSADGGDSWFPLWHDEPSLSMAALAISPSNQAVVWAGTGETKAGGSETIPAAGVWRSPNRGATWRAPNAGQTILAARIHALAAHPTNDQTCWAAATAPTADLYPAVAGLYRTTDGGRTWTRFAPGRGFTDVRFANIGGSLRLFAVLEGTTQRLGPPVTNHALLVRLDNPNDPDATLSPILNLPGPPDPLLAVGTTAPAVAAGRTDPRFGKVAIYDGSDPAFPNPVLFLALTHKTTGSDDSRVDRSFSAMFRCRDAHTAAASAMTFTPIPPAETFGAEIQGDYNIALAVSPRNPNHLAFGMVELYLNRNANANAPAATHWLRAQQWDLNIIERGHHADHHDLLFAPAPAAPFDNGAAPGALVLWDANDGGVSWCADWATATGYPLIDPAGTAPHAQATAQFPPPLDTLTWHKRSHGISATQMYDLTQHPRLPSVIGCGFQDNGVWLGLSGPSWQLALTADGGFVAFDPDDPYRMLVTYQLGIAEARFPGRLRTTLPLPRDSVQEALWPRDLEDGFLDADHAPFTAETAFHPRLPGRVLTARRHRLYGTRPTTGDLWIDEPLGTAFEIVHRPAQRDAAFSVLEVRDTPGGRALGLVPQRSVTVRADDEPHAESRVRSVRPGPYAIGAAMDLQLLVGTDLAAVPIAITVPLTVGAGLPASASASQVAAYLTGQFTTALVPTPVHLRPVVKAVNVVLPLPRELVIASTGSGVARQVVLSGSALGAATLSAVARAYHGAEAGTGPGAAAPALPAIAPIMVDIRAAVHNLAGRALRVTREGGASQVDIDFDTELPPPASSHVTIGQLIDVLRRRLPVAAYELWTNSAFRGLRLTSTATPATKITVLGNLTTVTPGAADSDVALVPTSPDRTRRLIGRRRPTTWLDTLDLSPIPPPPPPPTDRTLQLDEDGNKTALRALNLAFLGVTDLTRITMVELCDAVRRMLKAKPAVRIRCDLEFSAASESEPDERFAMGEVAELAFGPPGTRIAYAGDKAGRIYRSTDDGEHWEHRPSVMDDRSGVCDAIAVQPDNPDIVLAGLYAEGLLSADAVMLFRSSDGGATFAPAPAQIDNGQAGAARRIVGVRALVFDPGAPGHVYAATDLGVHHSPDAGQSWVPFNSGLPNVRVTDLALATQTRVLRAGAWGRGVYERRLDPAGVMDVRLHIRTTGLDDGTAPPAPGPDLLAALPESLRFDASPDIKLLRHDLRVGVVLDGAEFDELTSEDARVGPAFVAVQVHNRGAFPTPAPANPPNPAGPPVRVTALWAPADDGPPPLPPELWAALANPVAVGTAFGHWKVLGDEPISGPAGTGHETVAPGYPRVVVLGAATAFAWPADVEAHARVGIVAIARSADDTLPAAPTRPVGVVDLIRTEAKIGYRECAVSPAVEDDQIVLRTLDGSSIAIVAVGGAENAANGGVPFGLAAVALPGSPDVRFARAGPYALPARRRFRIQVRTAATATFAAGDPELLPNLDRVFATDAANVLNRAFVAAGVPVRAAARDLPTDNNDRLRLSTLSTTSFTVAGNAAATFGVTSGAGVTNFIDTPSGSKGPWNLTPAAPRSLTVTATTTVEIRLQAGQSGLPTAGPFSAAAIRTAITRQLARGGLANVVCEPVRRRLSLRRSVTETASIRHAIGSAVLADLVASAAAVAAGPAREALFDVVTTHGKDTIGAAGNHFYLRAANVGNVREAAVRHRLFLVDSSVTPVTIAQLGAGVVQPLAAATSGIVEFAAVAVAGVAAGDHRYVLAIADVNTAGLTLDPAAADLASLESLLTFCQRHPGAAVREFVGR